MVVEPLQFLQQVVLLSVWVFLAAGIYAAVEQWLSTNGEKS
jgi:hypothetical protein